MEAAAEERLSDRLFAYIKEFRDGCPDAELRQHFADVELSTLVDCINVLLSDQKLDILRSGSLIYYKAKLCTSSEHLKTLNATEAVIYNLIEDAQNRGIWVRDLRAKCNVPLAQLNKTLKQLESRKLVKCVNSIGSSRQKFYMLYDLVPEADLTGGTFYAEQTLDTAFVEAVTRQCLKFLKQKAQDQLTQEAGRSFMDWQYTDSSKVLRYINDLKISKVDLTLEEVEKIMDGLVYENQLECDQTGQLKMYRMARPVYSPGGFAQTPCSYCPVFDDCNSNGHISPGSCIYFDNLLK